MRLALLLLLPLLLLTGCLTSPPIIAVDSVEVVGRNDQAIALHYNLVLTNPNDKPIEPLEFTYSVSVSGRSVYKGRHAAEMTLDAGGQDRPMVLPAVIPFERIGWADSSVPDSAQWSMSGTLIYVDEGVFAQTLLDLGYRPSTGFSASGDLDTTGLVDEGEDPKGASQVPSSDQPPLSPFPAGS